MRREILALLILSTLVSAALDQSYVMTVDRDGNSEISKSMDFLVFTADFTAEDFAEVKEICQTDSEIDCGVEGSTLTITEKFAPGQHYSYSADYGIPYITYSLTLKSIPADKFDSTMNRLLMKAGAGDSSASSGIPIDLSNANENQENAKLLRKYDVNITYDIIMPTGVSYSKANGSDSGAISGNTVSYDVVSLMEQSEQVSVKSSELNMGYLIILAAAVVLGALAFSFFNSKPVKKTDKKKKK